MQIPGNPPYVLRGLPGLRHMGFKQKFILGMLGALVKLSGGWTQSGALKPAQVLHTPGKPAHVFIFLPHERHDIACEEWEHNK